jgi:hypothetical protein
MFVPFEITILPEKVEEAMERFKNEAINKITITYDEGWKINIFGNEIDLGVAVVSTDAFITNKDFKEIEKNATGNKGEIKFTLTPKENPIVVDFLKWDCEDRHTRTQISE